jgi:hypothetical protein
MLVYHCTTPKKQARYRATGAILPPVRYWTSPEQAERWAKRCQRSVILAFEEPRRSWPLPIKGGAKWSDQPVLMKDIEQAE